MLFKEDFKRSLTAVNVGIQTRRLNSFKLDHISCWDETEFREFMVLLMAPKTPQLVDEDEKIYEGQRSKGIIV